MQRDSRVEEEELTARSSSPVLRLSELPDVDERQVMAATEALFLGLMSPLKVKGVSYFLLSFSFHS